VDVGLHDDGEEGLVDAASGLEDGGEEAPPTQFRDGQIRVTRLGSGRQGAVPLRSLVRSSLRS
jgi:hypothetical protein